MPALRSLVFGRSPMRVVVLLSIFAFCRGGEILQAQIDKRNTDLEFLYPKHSQVVITGPGAVITGRFNLSKAAYVELLERAQVKRNIETATKVQKENFARQVQDMFPDKFILERAVLNTISLAGGNRTYRYDFSLVSNTDLKRFWSSTSFREMLAAVYDKNTLSCEVSFVGWSVKSLSVSDSTYHRKYGDIFSFSTSLSPGKNSFYLRTVDVDGSIGAYDSIAFYYKTAAMSEAVPEGFVSEPFHVDSVEHQCAPCHSLTLTEAVKKQKPAVEKECKTCHDILVSQKSSHAPAREWNCLLCHDPSSSPKYKLYPDKDYGAALCFGCHIGVRDSLSSESVTHAPAASGECLTCHDPHGSRHRSLVIAKINDVCGSCHDDISKVPHPVAGHPVSGHQDPLQPDRELSCVSCHNPHASRNSYLLPAAGSEICQKCHQM